MLSERHSLGISTNLDVLDRFLDVKDRFIVDAGCGDMNLSKQLALRGARVLGIDPDPVQAQLNQQAETVANVGFVETGADSIPVEPASVDGVVFPYSLHHVPGELYIAVFKEMSRVLKDNGFLYVMEPVASGSLNEVMRLFHDEQAVRTAAQHALDTLAIPLFEQLTVVEYSLSVKYASWEEYAERYSKKSYNTGYSEAQVRDKAVEQRFLELGEPVDFQFEFPMKVTYLRNLKRSELA